MILITIILGIALLIVGRKLYWFFVGLLGFAAASTLATQYLPAMDQLVVLGIALVAGIIGAILTVWMQRFAFAIAGFLGGAQIMLSLLKFAGLGKMAWFWFPVVLGGVIGAAFIIAFLDWALIIISSLGGAALLVQTLRMQPPTDFVGFLVLGMLGVIIQFWMMNREMEETKFHGHFDEE
jgi:hypothetical protein